MTNHTNQMDQEIDEILNSLHYAVDYLISDYADNNEEVAEYTANHVAELAQAHAGIKLLLLKARKEELESNCSQIYQFGKWKPLGIEMDEDEVNERIKSLGEEMKGLS